MVGARCHLPDLSALVPGQQRRRIGDLAGIAARLDHVATLGVDAIWLSPIFPSPMADFGYDVAEYCGIEPMFGDLAAFDRLLAAVHASGLKLLLDFVPNHSSDQHPWFHESRSSRHAAKRDWYIWRDPAADGGPPNNWISDFGGSAWEWDAETGQYFLHAFLKQQPDLNWRNPDLRAAMMDVLRFWLDRGVDGFRIDVLWHIVKAQGLPDNPVNPDWHPGQNARDQLIQTYSTDQPEAHAIAADMRALVDGYGDRVLVGEIFLPNDRHARWFGTAERPEVHLPFNFQLIENAWDAALLAKIIGAYDASIPAFGWPNWVFGSHDAPRIAARIGEAQARVAAMLLLTLRGTPTLFQGRRDRYRQGRYPRRPGAGSAGDPTARDRPGSRPVAHADAVDDTAHAGFSSVEPWLPLNPDWRTRNVAAQEADPRSMLHLYRSLLALRRTHAALSVGHFALVPADTGVLAYERSFDGVRLLIMLNLTATTRVLHLPAGATIDAVLASTLPARPMDGTLAGDEGLILRLTGTD